MFELTDRIGQLPGISSVSDGDLCPASAEELDGPDGPSEGAQSHHGDGESAQVFGGAAGVHDD